MAPSRKGRGPIFCGVQEWSPELCGGSSPVAAAPGQGNAPQECAKLAQPGRASRVQAEGWWSQSSCRHLRETKKLALSVRRNQTSPPPLPPHGRPGTTCLSEGNVTTSCFSPCSNSPFWLLKLPSTNPQHHVTLVTTCLSPRAMFQSAPWWNLSRRPPEH